MINIQYLIAVIAICSIVTILERALPFLLFRGKEVPGMVRYVGSVLPMAIMTTLIFYCMRSVQFSSAAAWLPQIGAGLLTVVLHLWKRNTLMSVAGGTVCCMLLSNLL